MLTHVWGMFTLPITLHAFHASYNFVSFTWESSWLTHVWEAMLLTPLAHVTIKGLLTHVWAYCPLWIGQNPNPCGVYLASTSLIPHQSWEILVLHLAFNLNHPLHLFSYKRRALSSFQKALSTSLLCCKNYEQPHPTTMKSSPLDDFMRFSLVLLWMV